MAVKCIHVNEDPCEARDTSHISHKHGRDRNCANTKATYLAWAPIKVFIQISIVSLENSTSSGLHGRQSKDFDGSEWSKQEHVTRLIGLYRMD